MEGWEGAWHTTEHGLNVGVGPPHQVWVPVKIILQ